MRAIGSSFLTRTFVTLLAVAAAACGSEEVPAPGAASLVFANTPESVVAGSAIGPFKVTVLDEGGDVFGSTRTVTLQLMRGDEVVPSFAAVADTTNGVATFEGLVLSEAGEGFSFIARSGSLAEVRSDAFDVVAAAPATLEMKGPATALVDDTVTFSVTSRDAFGNPAALPGGSVTVETSRNATSEVSSADGSEAKVSVVFKEPGATWVTIAFDNPALTATARIQVAQAGDIADLSFRLPERATAGDEVQAELVAFDVHGNVVTNFIGDVVFESPEATDVLPREVAFGPDDAGRLLVDGFRFTAAGKRDISATVGGVTQRATVQIDPGPVEELRIRGLDSDIVAGTQVTIEVDLLDEFGNAATNATGVVSVESGYPGFSSRRLPVGPGATATVTHPFRRASANAYPLTAYYGADVQRDALVRVRPAAAKNFVANPGVDETAPIVAGENETLVIRVVDEFGNRVTGYSGEIALTGTGIAVAPVATFDAASKGEISVTISGRTTPSGSVEISDVFGALPDLTVTWDVEPGPAVSLEAQADQTSLRPLETADLTLTAFDQYGNIATGIDHAVVLSLSSTGRPSVSFGQSRFRRGDAGVLLLEGALSMWHEGQFTVDIETDEGLTTSIDFEVNAVELDVQAVWSDNTAGNRSSLTVTAPLTAPWLSGSSLPVPDSGLVRLTLPPDIDLTWATITPTRGFVAPVVDIDGNTITVHVGGSDDDDAYRVSQTAIEITIDDLRHGTAAGPAGDVNLTLETSFDARIGAGQGGSRNLLPTAVDVLALGEFADELTTTVADRTITLSGLTSGRAYAFAVLESEEKAMQLACNGPTWLEVHDNRLVMELPPFQSIDETVSCSTLAGGLTVKIKAAADSMGIVTHLVGNDARLDLALFHAIQASDDGRWTPVTWLGAHGGPEAGIYDAFQGHVIPFPRTLGLQSSSPAVAARAPLAVAVVRAEGSTELNHDQIVTFNLIDGTTRVVSVTASNIRGNNHSSAPVLSPSGRYLLYFTRATNLGGTTYVLRDLQEGTQRAVALPAGLEAPNAIAYLNFSPDESEFTIAARESQTGNTVILAVDVSTLASRKIYQGTEYIGARFTRNGEGILLVGDGTTSSALVDTDGNNPVFVCDLAQLRPCYATDSTPEGWVTTWGQGYGDRARSAIVNPESGEVLSLETPGDDRRFFMAITSPQGHFLGMEASWLVEPLVNAPIQFAVRNRRTLEPISTVGFNGGRLLPSATRGLATSADDSVLAFDLGGQEVWARTGSGIARNVSVGIRPVVDPNGDFIVSTGEYGDGLFFADLATGEVRNLAENHPNPIIRYGPVYPLGISPGGTWVSFRTQSGSTSTFWVLNTDNHQLRQRNSASPVADGPDEGQGYVSFSPSSGTLLRMNPKTLGERALGTVPGLTVTNFHQHALTPDGNYAAYLATVSASPGYGTGKRLYLEDVLTGELHHLDRDENDIGIPNLDETRAISISADGRYVSFFADDKLWVASRTRGEARQVPVPAFDAPMAFAKLSSSGNRVYVGITDESFSSNFPHPDEHVYVFRNPFTP